MSCNLSAQCDENGNWIGDGACFVGCCDNITCPDLDPKCNQVVYNYKCGEVVLCAKLYPSAPGEVCPPPPDPTPSAPSPSSTLSTSGSCEGGGCAGYLAVNGGCTYTSNAPAGSTVYASYQDCECGAYGINCPGVPMIKSNFPTPTPIFNNIFALENPPGCCCEPQKSQLFNEYKCYKGIDELADDIIAFDQCCTDNQTGEDCGFLNAYIEDFGVQVCGDSGDCCCSMESGPCGTNTCSGTCHDVTVTITTNYECGISRTPATGQIKLVCPDGCCCKANPTIPVEVTASLQGGESCLVKFVQDATWTGSDTEVSANLYPCSGINAPSITTSTVERVVTTNCPGGIGFGNLFDIVGYNEELGGWLIGTPKCSCDLVESIYCSCCEQNNCCNSENGGGNGLQSVDCSTGANLFIKKIFGNKIRIKLNKKELMHRIQQSAKFRITKRQRRNMKFK